MSAIAFEFRAEKLDLFDAHAVGEKRLDHPASIQRFQHRGLKCGPARLVVRRRPLLDDPRPHAVTEELARGEKARGTRADDEDLRIGPRASSGCAAPATFRLPQSFFDTLEVACSLAIKQRRRGSSGRRRRRQQSTKSTMPRLVNWKTGSQEGLPNVRPWIARFTQEERRHSPSAWNRATRPALVDRLFGPVGSEG